jgi:hypothetical protein
MTLLDDVFTALQRVMADTDKDSAVAHVRTNIAVTRVEWEMQRDDAMRREMVRVRLRRAMQDGLNEVEQRP